ncbi:AAA family ATPase [Bradyrhizobium diazoefficiens]|uniref:AAA family ATPase n=1 Tax=Bradyrhizobium diazoefficiens TaxID=1355477 RepID=UPI0004B53479|nr:AAA family ATPase [Bradyrhizobium diazoefficiens]
MNRLDHPALQILLCRRWDEAFASLWAVSEGLLGKECSEAIIGTGTDSKRLRNEIAMAVDALYARGVGALALAWSMLTVSPLQRSTFHTVLPQLQHALDGADLPDDDDAELRARLRIWWRAAEGEFDENARSIFHIADEHVRAEDDDPVFQAGDITSADDLAVALGLPTLVVMPKNKASKLKGEHSPYKEILDAPLRLVVARDLSKVRATLHAEYPHATFAVDLLLRDLREGQPVRLKSAILCGSPGCGKSRLIRRIGDLLGIGIYRFDGGSSADGVGYGGTPRGWAESTPCVPARAVQMFKTANVICAVEELDKASVNERNGALWSVLLQHTERETAARFRDVSLDAELDLSWISHLATANSVDPLPTPLKDRYRLIRMPDPSLEHLPRLAANVMRDLAAEDEARAGDEPLADDELANIGRAWAERKFSMRALQKIVAATLEARDQHAIRH